MYKRPSSTVKKLWPPSIMISRPASCRVSGRPSNFTATRNGSFTVGIYHRVYAGGGKSYGQVILRAGILQAGDWGFGAFAGVAKRFQTIEPPALQVYRSLACRDHCNLGSFPAHRSIAGGRYSRHCASRFYRIRRRAPGSCLGGNRGWRLGCSRRGDQWGSQRFATQVCPRFLQQVPYLLLGSPITSFAEVGVPDHAVFVHQVFSGPKPVAVSVPGGEAVVLGYGVHQPRRPRAGGHVCSDLLELELRGMHSHDDQPIFGIPGIPIG